MDALYTFWDNITHYKTKSVHFLGLMNSATKFSLVTSRPRFGVGGFAVEWNQTPHANQDMVHTVAIAGTQTLM